MTDVVTIGAATLYCGDCLAVAAATLNDRVDHTITDPPYEAEAHTASRRVATSAGLVIQAHAFAAMDERTRKEISRLIVGKTTKWSLIFCQNDGAHLWEENIEACGASYHSTMIWVKPDGKPNFSSNGPGIGYESIVVGWCGKNRSYWNGGGKNGVFIVNKNEERDEGNIHTTIKPQKLMTEIVGLFTNKDEIVFDPFMGSGSTGVAAVGMGRRFVGIERDPKYFDIACRRIEKAQEEGLLNAPYVKTKTKITVPLLQQMEKPKLVVTSTKRAPAAPAAKRMSMPNIVMNRTIVPAAKRIPYSDPFAAHHADALRAAGDGRMCFDEETWEDAPGQHVGVDVESFANFFLVCCERMSDGKRIAFELSDRSQLDINKLRSVVEGNCIITFNGATYDVPMIYLALKGATAAQLKIASDRIIKGGLQRWDAERELGVSIPRLDHIDLLEPNPSVKQGLKILAGRLHSRFLVDLPFDEEAWLSHQQMNMTTLYCFNDIAGTRLVLDAMKEPLDLRRALGKEYNIDLRSRSDAQVGEAIVKRRVEQAIGHRIGKQDSISNPAFQYETPQFIQFEDEHMNAILRDLRGTKFYLDGAGRVATPPLLEKLEVQIGGSTYAMGIGGLHSQEEHRALRSDEDHVLIDLDVASQYPNIIVKLGLYPKAMGPAFLKVYAGLIEERLAAKAAGDRTKADGGKIALNGVYGKLGSQYSALYAPHLMIAVTLTGQLSLLMLIERCEAAGLAVVSGNTDGVVLRCPISLLNDLDKIVQQWERDTGFSVERTRYKAIYNSSVNTYLAVREDGKVKRKGAIADPWKEKDLRVQMSKNPQMTVCAEAVERFVIDGIPIADTVRACRDPRAFVTVIKVTGGATWRGHEIGRAVRYYWSMDGDPFLYKTAQRKVPKTDGSRPMMLLPESLPIDIDWERYETEAKRLAVDLGAVAGGELI